MSDKELKIVKYPESVVYTDVGGGGSSSGGDGEKALQNTTSKLELLATSDVFSKGKLTLACEATQFSLYRKRTEIKLSEDAPQLAHVLSPTTRNYSGTYA